MGQMSGYIAMGCSSQQINAYYLELERFLGQIEQAATHYEVLGLRHSASGEEIRQAYQRAVAWLHPYHRRIYPELPEAVIARMDRAWSKVTQAFSSLSNFGKRVEYNNLLLQKPNKPIVLGRQGKPEAIDSSARLAASTEQMNSPVVAPETCHLAQVQEHSKVYSEFAISTSNDNRRRFERFALSIPVYVTGYDRSCGQWHEMTRTLDVSRLGARLKLRRRVQHRTLLHLALPLPMRLRCYRHYDPSYSVYALVRRIEPIKDGFRVVGVEFIGEHPPGGYCNKPWATYMTKWDGAERRRALRQKRIESVHIEYFNEAMECIAQEVAATEDISSGGMRVVVKTAPPDFEMVRVTCSSLGIESFAAACNRYAPKGESERLCLQFLK
jgi:hypothetical protein